MIALKRVKTLPAMMLEVEREDVSCGSPSLRRRSWASLLESPISAYPSEDGTGLFNRVEPMGLKLGVNLGYWGIGPAGEDALELVLAAERLGFESVWVAESYGSDVTSVLAWFAGQTKTINLGDALPQGPARPPGPPLRPAPLRRRRRGQGAEAELPPAAQRDPGVRRRDRAQIGADGGRSRRRLDPDLLLRRPLPGDLGRAPLGGLRQRRALARRPRGLADPAGRDRRRPRG